MGDNHKSDPQFFLQVHQFKLRVLAQFLIQRRQWLIEQQQAGALDQCPGYRDVLDPRVIESHIRTLCLFVLEMLDKRDEWEWYLATWDLMRAHTSCGLTYAHTARLTHGPRLTPFILGEDARGLHVHYLYLIAYRKAVVERKRDRQRRGGKLGHCWHGRQEALSDAEIHERLGRVAQLVREAARQR